MKFRFYLTTLLTSLAILASAQTDSDPMYMVLTMKDGQLKAINITDVNRLTFPSGIMKVEKKDGSSEQIYIQDINIMEYSSSETGGINSILKEGESLKFNNASHLLTFNGIKGANLMIYDIKGALMIRHCTSQGAQSIDLSALSDGVYIVNYNGKSIKIKK